VDGGPKLLESGLAAFLGDDAEKDCEAQAHDDLNRIII
jgi:hypothetical protein